MGGKSPQPDQIAAGLALREAGYSVLAISQKLGIPPRTLERHFSKHGAKKGALAEAAIDAARSDLLRHVTSDDAIREEAAKMIADDLAHARHVRSIIAKAAEKLTATSLQDAVLVMRAAAAYSTAVKNTSDTIRHSIRLDQTSDGTKPLPELVVAELTAAEIVGLRSHSD